MARFPLTGPSPGTPAALHTSAESPLRAPRLPALWRCEGAGVGRSSCLDSHVEASRQSVLQPQGPARQWSQKRLRGRGTGRNQPVIPGFETGRRKTRPTLWGLAALGRASARHAAYRERTVASRFPWLVFLRLVRDAPCRSWDPRAGAGP